MTKTITVKGIGKVTAAPDFVILSLGLESKDPAYEKAMNRASDSIVRLESALEEAGIDRNCIKTTDFHVHTEYEYVHKNNGSSERVFCGYVVSHQLKVEFDFDTKQLSNALSAIGSSPAHPQVTVSFTVKDAAAVSEEMLRSATENAKRKAEILCDASRKKLGDLISIDYNWGEMNIYSNTAYNVEEDCLAAPVLAKCSSIDIRPDDISVTDTATFVWEIC